MRVFDYKDWGMQSIQTVVYTTVICEILTVTNFRIMICWNVAPCSLIDACSVIRHVNSHARGITSQKSKEKRGLACVSSEVENQSLVVVSWLTLWTLSFVFINIDHTLRCGNRFDARAQACFFHNKCHYILVDAVAPSAMGDINSL